MVRRRLISGVFPQNPEDLALDADVSSRGIDGRHLRVGGLQADHAAFTVEAFEGSVRAIDKSYDNLAFACRAGPFDENVVPGDDVFVAHGVAPDFESEDFAVADDVREGDALGAFNGFNRLTGCDPAEQRKTVSAFFAVTGGENINRAAAVVRSLEKAFVLKISDVFMYGGQRAEPQTRGDLLIGWGVAVFLGEAGEEVDNLFLPPCDSHAHDCSE